MSTTTPILPGAMLGVIGGGQLGRMFVIAARTMGYRVTVLDPEAGCPAGCVADVHLCADYADAKALKTMMETCAAVTTEFENVPAESMRYLAEHIRVSPSADAIAIAQDRVLEKQFLLRQGFAVAPFTVIESLNDFDKLSAALLPGILKRSRYGYDGKGQVRVQTIEQARTAFTSLGNVPCVLEQMVPLKSEISVIVARGSDGHASCFPVAENQHTNGILDISIVPARVGPDLTRHARETALGLAEKMNYCGVLAIEFFVLRDNRLLINEMAPRPHNSGHYTIDACVSSQFEQQVRTLCDLPLGNTQLICPAVMVNILGDAWAQGEPPWSEFLAQPNLKLHLYGKAAARAGRKMGHFTCLDHSLNHALAEAIKSRRLLTSEALLAEA